MCNNCTEEIIEIKDEYTVVRVDGKIKIKVDRVIPEFDEGVELKPNAMLSVRLELYNQWYFEKNTELGFDVYTITKGSGKKVWWICKDCGSPYSSPITSRIRGQNCSYCAGKKINETNSLVSLRPDIASEWDYALNGDLSPYEVACNSDTIVWWYCNTCEDSYDTRIKDKVKASGCPYCSGHRVNIKNCLATINPELTKQWHPTKNGDKTPFSYMPNSHEVVWWLCELGHYWETSIKSRNNNRDCPYCAGKKVWIGFNDMWTTNPELANKLLNSDDGYKYTQLSSQRTDWKCLCCGEIIKDKRIADINKYGLSCPLCSDGKSYPEKFMSNLLNFLNIKFINDTNLKWSERKRYDFYLDDYNCIIECHGEQHSGDGFESAGGRSLEEEIENDKYKYDLALKNGIEHYIVIDAKISELEYMRQSIINSELFNLFDLSTVDWSLIDEKAQKSISIEALKLWNEGLEDVNKIAEILCVTPVTIRKYLKIWNKNGKCDFSNYDKRIRKIVQLTLNYEYINEWDSIADAIRGNANLNIRQSSISLNLNNRGSSAGGFKWMYKEIYENYLETGKSPHPVIDNSHKCRKIVKLDLNDNLLDKYDSIKEASIENNIKNSSAISQVLSGKRKISHGFKWMYLTEYNNMINQQQAD